MKFKLGDKVRFKSGDYVPQGTIITNAEYCNKYGYSLSGAYEVESVNSESVVCKGIGRHLADRVELAEQPKPIEPQVGDVWASEDKSKVVRVLGKFERNGFNFVSYLGLRGECKGVANFSRKQFFFDKFPTFLHRPQKPKKQPKPVTETPKKQKEEEKWEEFYGSGLGIDRAFRKGNQVKYVSADGTEGIATCHKKDEFNLRFGIDLAWHRAEIKRHTKEMNAMLGREEQK